jgi:hypothetical protein
VGKKKKNSELPFFFSLGWPAAYQGREERFLFQVLKIPLFVGYELYHHFNRQSVDFFQLSLYVEGNEISYLNYHLIIYLCQNFTWTNNINMRSGSSLLPPTIGMLKWNVNASSSCKPRPSRIDGVLRDCERRFLCFFFSCSTSNMKSNEAQVLVIQKAAF